MSSATIRNLHVPLSDDLYSDLRREAVRSRRPATALARKATRQWVEARRRSDLAAEIERYARAAAGTRDDLDESSEAASIEAWLAGERRK